MLTKTQLRDLHDEDVPLHILELGYIQSIVLKHIFLKDDDLVFKGGTCLRKVHGLNRFSEDLDFNLIKGDAESNLKEGTNGLKKTGIDAEILHFDDRKDVVLAKIRYEGPLYSGTELSKGSLQIDISKHEVYKDPSWQTITERYSDVGTYSIMSMEEEEILAEKFRSLVQRDMPRDFYDIWFLFEKGIEIDLDILEKKFKELDMISKKPKKIIDEYDITDEDWKRDPGNLMNRVPKKDRVIDDINDHLKTNIEK